MERSDYLPTARLHELAAQVDPQIRLEADAEQARRCSRPLPPPARAQLACTGCSFELAEEPAAGIGRGLATWCTWIDLHRIIRARSPPWQ
jgi:hypothetical protein